MQLSKLFVLVAAVGLVGGGPGRADDSMPAGNADQMARKAAVEVVTVGAELFNAGNQEACYRLYQGALTALKPTLAHRPLLVKMIQDRLDKAKGLRTPAERAFALREALDEVMKEPGAKMAPPSGKKPLWDRLGGEKGVRAVTREFLATASKDPKANLDRNGNYPLTKERVERVEQLVVEFVSSVTGGPLKYNGRDMKNAHQGMMITQDEFNAAAGHLIAALKKYEVPQAEIDELVGLVGGIAKDIIEVKK